MSARFSAAALRQQHIFLSPSQIQALFFSDKVTCLELVLDLFCTRGRVNNGKRPNGGSIGRMGCGVSLLRFFSIGRMVCGVLLLVFLRGSSIAGATIHNAHTRGGNC